MVDEKITDAARNGSASPPPQTDPVNTAGQPPENLWNNLQQELKELKKSFADLKRQGLPEIEQVKQQLLDTVSERDNVAGELRILRRNNSIAALAEQYGFTDKEYLDFVLHKNQIDPEQTDRAAQFMQQFKAEHPRCFALPVKAGSGSRPGAAPHTGIGNNSGSRMDALENMLNHAREIY